MTSFGPRSLHVARFILQARAETLVGLLDEVAAAWPDLSFDDFRGGYILSDMLVRFPDQLRPLPGDDPIRWLDEVIACGAPARGRA